MCTSFGDLRAYYRRDAVHGSRSDEMLSELTARWAAAAGLLWERRIAVALHAWKVFSRADDEDRIRAQIDRLRK